MENNNFKTNYCQNNMERNIMSQVQDGNNRIHNFSVNVNQDVGYMNNNQRYYSDNSYDYYNDNNDHCNCGNDDHECCGGNGDHECCNGNGGNCNCHDKNEYNIINFISDKDRHLGRISTPQVMNYNIDIDESTTVYIRESVDNIVLNDDIKNGYQSRTLIIPNDVFEGLSFDREHVMEVFVKLSSGQIEYRRWKFIKVKPSASNSDANLLNYLERANIRYKRDTNGNVFAFVTVDGEDKTEAMSHMMDRIKFNFLRRDNDGNFITEVLLDNKKVGL